MEIKKMGRTNISGFFYYFIRKVRSYYFGSIPFMGEKEGLEAVDSADKAYNNGQGFVLATMLVRAHKMHDSFVVQMEATRDAVVKF
jgi:hypothetical protein